jgi:DNA anti-recombination protein RmuC
MFSLLVTLLVILLLVVIFLLLYLIYFFKNKFNQEISNKNFLELQNKIFENFNLLKQETLQHLGLITQKQEKFIESTSKIEELARHLETSSLEIKTVKEILAGPKSRGYLGEVMLKEILKNLPSSFYEEQFPIGFDRVDYVLKLNDTIIPIDSKFPVQNYNEIFRLQEKDKQALKKDLIRNLKSKIDDISRKYILPLKGTVEFALMYLANEGIYYELLSDKDYDEVWEYAREKSVFLTSPKNFEFICSSLLLVVRKQEFSQNIHQILANLHQFEKDLLELSQQFEKSFNQLKYSYDNLDKFAKILNRFIINFRSLIKSEQKLEEKIKEKSLI